MIIDNFKDRNIKVTESISDINGVDFSYITNYDTFNYEVENNNKVVLKFTFLSIANFKSLNMTFESSLFDNVVVSYSLNNYDYVNIHTSEDNLKLNLNNIDIKCNYLKFTFNTVTNLKITSLLSVGEDVIDIDKMINEYNIDNIHKEVGRNIIFKDTNIFYNVEKLTELYNGKYSEFDMSKVKFL